MDKKLQIPYTQIGILFFWFCYLFLNNKSNLLEEQSDVFFGLYTFASIAFYLIVMFYGYRMLSFFDKRDLKSYIKKVIPYFLCLLLFNFMILVKDIGFSISLGFAKDYVKKVLEQPNREYMAYAYVLAVFIIFVPFLKEMLHHLSNTERKWLFFVILGYFTFMTSEFFFEYVIHIANFPFINMWGYILTGWLLKNVSWSKVESGDLVNKVTIHLANLTYYIYLLHELGQDFVFKNIPFPITNVYIGLLWTAFATILVSILLAEVLNIILLAIKKIKRKIIACS